MVVTESGMVMDTNELQWAKAKYPMVVTELLMITDANDLQC